MVASIFLPVLAVLATLLDTIPPPKLSTAAIVAPFNKALFLKELNFSSSCTKAINSCSVGILPSGFSSSANSFIIKSPNLLAVSIPPPIVDINPLIKEAVVPIGPAIDPTAAVPAPTVVAAATNSPDFIAFT